jgi:4-amino-4-deoxy-L-arabinose transferase-like glycosyltransferase
VSTVSESRSGSAIGAVFGRLAARPDARFLTIVTGLALLVRLLMILMVQRGNNFAFNDAFFYHSVAAMAADGKGFATLDGRPFGQWPPGYPFLLSLVYRVTGTHPLPGEFVNAVIGSATVPLIYAVGLRAFGTVEAKFCAIALAFFPGQIFFADVLMSEPLFVFMIVLVLWIISHREPSLQTAAALGIVIGLAVLTRGEGPMMFLMPAAAWATKISRRELAERMAVVVGVAVLCVVPWTLRNYSVFHQFIPVSTNFGSTFWAGHNPTATGEQTYPPASLTAQAGPSNARFYQIEQSKVLQKAATDWIKQNPIKDLSLIPWRVLGLTQGDGDAIYYWVNKTGNGVKPLSKPWADRLATVGDIGWYLLLTAFLSSLVVFGRTMLRNGVLRACLAYMSASIMLYAIVLYGQFRYHVPLEPMMILISAPLVSQLIAVRSRRITAARQSS